MKPTYLQDLLPYMKGKVIVGETNPLIRHVIKIPKYSLLKDHTLYFHNKGTLSLKASNHFKQLTIITSKPDLLVDAGRNVTIVFVKNVKTAYWRFVDFYRNTLKIPFVAITGTCGKTTTKEMISWIFSQKFNVYKTIRNENDPSRHLDYLLGIKQSDDLAVMETAVAVPGHLKRAYQYFKPHVGILTSIGIDHLNGFPDLDSYINEKLSIFSLIDSKGTVIVNGDDDSVRKIDLKKMNKKIVTFGMNDNADFKIVKIMYEQNKMKFQLIYDRDSYIFEVPGLGKHNVYNATAAIAAAYQLGMSIESAGKRLASFPLLPRHVEIVRGINGSTLIDDTWSSNPTSIESSLDVLSNVAKGNKKIAVFGDIKYLGDKTSEIHTLVGDIVAKEEIDYLLTIGKEAELIGLQAIKKGMDSKKILHCQDPTKAYRFLSDTADEDSIILIKTSMYQSYKKFVNSLRVN